MLADDESARRVRGISVGYALAILTALVACLLYWVSYL
jgi:hypothetical protein